MFNRMHLWALSLLTALLHSSCSTPDDVAGGVSEETNTVAGVIVDSRGPAAGVAVVARHLLDSSLMYADTTDETGEFALPISLKGIYGIEAQTDSLALYKTVYYTGKKIEGLSLELETTTSFKGRIIQDSSLTGVYSNPTEIVVKLPGTSWSVGADSTGEFKFSGIPVGNYTILVKSPDGRFYDNIAYRVSANSDSVTLAGPLPTSEEGGFVEGSDSSALNFETITSTATADSECEIHLPLSWQSGFLSWWSMDYLASSQTQRILSNSRTNIDGILLYGDAEIVTGILGNALSLKGADQFGVVEDDFGAFDNSEEFSIEMSLYVDSVSSDSSYRRNIMGKLGFGSADDHDVFSLALVDGVCGVSNAHLAFFLADGSGDSLSCENAVISNESALFNTWFHLVVTFKSGTLKMYVDGVLDAEKETDISILSSSDESIFFGKENLNLMLDEVRLDKKAITSTDVLYRYNKNLYEGYNNH